ncbi:endophilin-B1-like isoform X2 [Antennarius striatus]|uniref:endophilin-B1-like isoform X2 n=1 Tax=Antennarius striatus TaxID=241820 RepID=UPI0035B181D7
MDLTRLAVDAGQFINRAVQLTGETLGQADRTELDPDLEELLTRTDATKTWTDRLASQTEVLLQPNPGARLEDRLYGHLDWTVPPRPRLLESLGDQMLEAGQDMGPNTPYGASLLRCGRTQKLLGAAEKKFVESVCILFLNPLRRFTEVEYGVVQDERRVLLNKRLDLDIAINRLRKAHEADREARNLNSSPLDNDYLTTHVSYMFSFLRVKWLKMWAQEISQAEMELKICQSLFDRQSATMRRAVEGIGNTHMNHLRSLGDFVDAQACYYDQCNRHAQELQIQLASIPAVLCSNNWQSVVSPHEPTDSNKSDETPSTNNTVTETPSTNNTVAETTSTNNTTNETPSTNKTINETTSTNNTTNETPSTNKTTNETPSTNKTVNETTSTNNTVTETTSTNNTTNETPSTNKTINETTSTNNTVTETTSTNNTTNETPSTNNTTNETRLVHNSNTDPVERKSAG